MSVRLRLDIDLALDGANVLVQFLDIPGAHTQGRTLLEAIERAGEVLALCAPEVVAYLGACCSNAPGDLRDFRAMNKLPHST